MENKVMEIVDWKIDSEGDGTIWVGPMACTADERKFAETVVAALNDYRPWKYPSRGELPDKPGLFLVTYIFNKESYVDARRWDGSYWMGINPIAWRELPEPAPVTEEEQ